MRIDLGEREDGASLDVPSRSTCPADRLGHARTGNPEDVVTGDDGNDVVEAGGGNDRSTAAPATTARRRRRRRRDHGGRRARRPRPLWKRQRRRRRGPYDAIDAHCETVQRRFVPAPAGAPPDPNDRVAPRFPAGGRSRQRLGAGACGCLRRRASSAPWPPRASSSAGISLRCRATGAPLPSVAGGRADHPLQPPAAGLSRQALARGRRATVRIWVLGTDLSADSAKARPIRISLRG